MLSHIPVRKLHVTRPVSPVLVDANTPIPPALPVRLEFDGSCKPNPGPMGIGYVINTGLEPRVDVVRVGAQIGQGTNNEAEYQALLAGLRHALRLGYWHLNIRSDSLLVVNQLKGEWAVKDKHLARLHREAMNLLRLLTYRLDHVRREENQVADYLSHQMVFEEPEQPALPPAKTSRFPRVLYDWQAAAIRAWWLRYSPGAGTLARIFGITSSMVEQIGYGKSYKDATFASFPNAAPAGPR